MCRTLSSLLHVASSRLIFDLFNFSRLRFGRVSLIVSLAMFRLLSQTYPSSF